MNVKFTASSWRRMQQIRNYHSKKGNSGKGRKITYKILEKAKTLENHPYMGQEEENLKTLGQGHRYLLIDKLYKVIYLIPDSTIFITDIFDTRQDPEKMKP